MLFFEETWIGPEESPPVFPGYRVFHFARPLRNPTSNPRGGTAIYVADALAPFTEEWPEKGSVGDRVSWIRINKEAGLVEDLYIAACYFPPKDTLGYPQLEHDIPTAQGDDDGMVLIAGDFNAHTGCSADRWSQDGNRPVDAPGKELLKLVECTGLNIANGIVPGPTSGNFTFWNTSNHKSVTDYFLLCPKMMEKATHLCVAPPEGSFDHCAMRLTLSGIFPGLTQAPPTAPQASTVAMLPAPFRYILSTPEQEEQFISILSEASELFATIQEAAESSAPDALKAFFQLYDSAMEQVGAKKITIGRSRVYDSRAARRSRIRATPAMRQLVRERRKAARQQNLTTARQLDRQIGNLSRSLLRKEKEKSEAELLSAWKNNPRAFWKTFASEGGACGHSATQMHTYCEQLLGGSPDDSPIPDTIDLPDYLCGNGAELNYEFSSEEIIFGLATLKGSKAVAGFLDVDLLKKAAEHVAPAIAAIFNAVVREKQMPKEMAMGIITMVLKPRATSTDLKDHRTITVCSLLDKLYSTCLTKRLSAWGEENSLRAGTQTGFRGGHQTNDNALVVRALTERYRHENQPLYCAFIDFAKAYDTVPREKLWRKLEARGVSGWMLTALQAQYSEVPLSVKTPAGLTSPFLCTVGLKQGEPSSPDLFGFYIDDLPHCIEALGPNAALPTLQGSSIPPLLHADDVAITSTTIAGLQLQLLALEKYAATWGLQISLAKTKLMQLSGAAANSNLTARPTVIVCGQALPWVRDFVYLGVPFYESGEMDAPMAEERLRKGRRSMAALRYRCAQLGITQPALIAKLFDTTVVSTLGYGIELWGPGYLLRDAVLTQKDGAEVLHREFLRRVLGVRHTTPNLVTYAEFGRFPLRYFWQKQVYSFWQRVSGLATTGAREILAVALKDNMQLAAQQRQEGMAVDQQAWAGKVAALLATLDIDVDLTAVPVALDMPPIIVQSAGQATHLAKLQVDTGTKTTTYKRDIRGWENNSGITTASYTLQPYLQTTMPIKRRWELARFRTSSHHLWVETARHQIVHPAREARACRLCNSGHVEDEYHMVFNCSFPALDEIRTQYSNLFDNVSSRTSLASFLAQPQRQVASFISQCFAAGDYASLSKPLYLPQDAAQQPEEPAVPPRRSPRLNS